MAVISFCVCTQRIGCNSLGDRKTFIFKADEGSNMEFRQSGDFVFFVSEGGEETFMGLAKNRLVLLLLN